MSGYPDLLIKSLLDDAKQLRDFDNWDRKGVVPPRPDDHELAISLGQAADTIQRQSALIAKYEERLEIDHAYESIPEDERANMPVRDPVTGRLNFLRRIEIPPEQRPDMPDKVLALEIEVMHLQEVIRDAYKAIAMYQLAQQAQGRTHVVFDEGLMECLRFYAWKADQRENSHDQEEDDQEDGQADPGKEPSEGA